VYSQFVNSLGIEGLGLRTLYALNDPSNIPAGYGSLTITVVPEPSIAAMVTLSLLGLAYRPSRKAQRGDRGKHKSSV
jgi:hypothetical protein